MGKSFIAALLTQHHRGRSDKVICIDTDPVNATFAGYKAFEAQRLEIMAGDDIDPRAFDQLIEAIMTADDDAVMIVDNGAATFVPLCSYLLENDVLALLSEEGHAVRFHAVITGGQGLRDTLVGLDALCGNFPDVPVVVWLNEYFGKPQENGKAFEGFKVYTDNAHRIHALITLPSVRPETFGKDIEAMLRQRLSFDEALASADFSVMARQRLKSYQRDIEARMAEAML